MLQPISIRVEQAVGWAKALLRRAHHLASAYVNQSNGGHAINRAFARSPALPTLRSVMVAASGAPAAT
jgi:hypothetical protein